MSEKDINYQKEKFIFPDENGNIYFFENKKDEKNLGVENKEEIKNIYSIKNFLIKFILFIVIIIILIESNLITSQKNNKKKITEKKDNSPIAEELNKPNNINNINNQSDKYDNTDNINTETDTSIETKTDIPNDIKTDTPKDITTDTPIEIKTDSPREINTDIIPTDAITDLENEQSENIQEQKNLLTIYICTHKDFPDKINNRTYYKILCDRTDQLRNKYSLDIITTDKDNELYPKNRGYSECSKIYYIWKQFKNGNITSEYVGFNHYRRIFTFKNNIPNLTEIFNKHDAILHSGYDLKATIREHYNKYHFPNFLNDVIEIIKQNFTNYYEIALKSLERKKMNKCNIFLMKSEKFVEYGEFLFGVLMEFDRRHNLKNDDDLKRFVLQEFSKTQNNGMRNNNVDYQSRVEAFLSERISQIFYDYHFKNPLEIKVTNLS